MKGRKRRFSLVNIDLKQNRLVRTASNERGTQVNLGTNKYDGYEAMGSRTFANPTESGYLQRKASGCTDTFQAYRFTLEAGVPFGAAVSIIVTLIKEGGGAIAELIAHALGRS